MDSGSTLHLFFGDHVHAVDAAQKDAGTAKILEPQHRPRAALDRPMVLLDKIVEILGLADPEGRFAISIDGFERSAIGTAFVDSHYLGNAVMSDRFLKETPYCDLVPLSAQQLGAYFTPSWTRISRQAGQAFHTKLDTVFTASWTVSS